MTTLEGQVALVTGAGSGIGKAIALALAKEKAHVALVGRRAELLGQVTEEVGGLGATALMYPADITDAAAMIAAVDAVVAQFGKIDILVNSAGDNVRDRGLDSITEDKWRYMLDTNLTGHFLCTRAVLPIMRSQRRGTIINISSLAASRASLTGGVAYSAAKAGLARLTESINLEERRYGIRACAINPGEVDTPLIRRRPFPVLSLADFANLLRPEDIAAAAVFVASLPDRAVVEELTMQPRVQRGDTGGQPPAESTSASPRQ